MEQKKRQFISDSLQGIDYKNMRMDWGREDDLKLLQLLCIKNKKWDEISFEMKIGREVLQRRFSKLNSCRNWSHQMDLLVVKMREEERAGWREISNALTMIKNNCERRYQFLKREKIKDPGFRESLYQTVGVESEDLERSSKMAKTKKIKKDRWPCFLDLIKVK